MNKEIPQNQESLTQEFFPTPTPEKPVRPTAPVEKVLGGSDQKSFVAGVFEDLEKNPEKLSQVPVKRIEAVAAGLPSKTGKRLFERLCNLRKEATEKLKGARYKIATSFAIAYLISGCTGQISKPSFEDIRAHLKPSPAYATEMAPKETLWQIQAAKEVFIVVEKQPVETQDPYLEDLARQNLIEKEMADLKVKHQLTVATAPEEDLAQSKELRAEQVKLTEKEVAPEAKTPEKTSIEARVETMGAATYEYHYIGNPELLEQLRARVPHLARLLESDRLTLVTSEEEGQVIVPQYAEKIFEVDGKHFIEVEMGGKTQMIEVDVPEGTKGLWMNCQTSAISSGLAQTYEEQQLPENFEILGGKIIYQNNEPEKIEHITQLSWGPLTKLVLGEAKQIIWGDRVITSPFHQGEFASLVQKTQNLSYNYDKIDFVELDQGLQEFLGAMRTLSDKGQGVSLAFRLGETGGHADTLWGFTVNPDNQRIEGILLTTGWPIEWKSYQEMGAIPFENGVYIPTAITDENGQMVPNRALMQYLIPQGTLVSQKL